MKSVKSNYTWINGEMIASDNATVPFLTSGFHYGVAVFEGIRAYKTPEGTAVFRLHDHMVRLLASARAYGLPMKESAEEMDEAVRNTPTAEQLRALYGREEPGQ